MLQKFIKEHKNLIAICAVFIGIILTWNFIRSLSVTTTSGAWDGVVSLSFSGGNGTEDNPYIISNAGEYAYLKSVLESTNASLYADKYYKITNSFDFGNYEISINVKDMSFSGTIDGNNNIIANATITGNLFNELNGATIKNIGFEDSEYIAVDNSGLFATTSSGSNFDFIIIETNITEGETTSFSGFIYNDNSSIFDNIAINNSYNSTNLDVSSFIYSSSESAIEKVLINTNDYNYIKNNNNTDITNIYSYEYANNTMTVSDNILKTFSNNNTKIIIDNNEFIFDKVENVPERLRTAYSEHASGIDGTTVYINDLGTDYNYYMGLNYTTSTNANTPTMLDKSLYSSNNLVKVEVIYDGIMIDSVTEQAKYTGTVSYVSGENQNKFIYYKYYPIENGVIDIELIDNPFAGRPYDMAFNGWVTPDENIEMYLDQDYYVWHALVSVTDTTPIALTFKASWIKADMAEATTSRSINNTINTLPTATMHTIDKGIAMDISTTDYYTQTTISRNNSIAGYYDANGVLLSGRCGERNGCVVYAKVSSPTDYVNGTNYFTLVNGTMTPTTPTLYSIYYQNMNMAGFYKYVTLTSGQSRNGFVDANGAQLSGNCPNTCNVYERISWYASNNTENIFDISSTYYYLTTRDTNIVYLYGNTNTTNWTNTRPFTLTSYYNGVDRRSNAYIRTSTTGNSYTGYIAIRDDTRIEYVRFYSQTSHSTTVTGYATNMTSSGYIYGNSFNFKIGRGTTRGGTLSAKGLCGGSNGNSTYNNSKYKFIVESGFYDLISATTLNGAATYNNADIIAVYGSDYDRVTNDNSLLDVYNIAEAAHQSYLMTTDFSHSAVHQIAKSGSFGTCKAGANKGIYVSSVYIRILNAPLKFTLEGGDIYTLNGGPAFTTDVQNYNAVHMYIKGGTAEYVFGGAASGATYGNRIIQVTGGTINYSLFGGSNGYAGTEGNDNSNARLMGDTYIYVGGNAEIGSATNVNGNNSLYNAEAGSIFGIGNGVSGTATIGSADNSYIVIDTNALIRRNVYGGGNNAAVGSVSGVDSETKVKVLGGTVTGSVYGSGNNNGTGTTSTTGTVTVDVAGGTIGGSVYGGSNESGSVYGNTVVTATGGTIGNSIYGGGQGSSTSVRNNVTVNIGDGTNSPTITRNIYGGSAFGTVNGITTGNTHTETNGATTIVNINSGTYANQVFGGGEGNNNTTPYTLGTATVNVNGGNIGSVFGGNDQAGNMTHPTTVNLIGGTVGNAFGGGNRSSVTTTYVNLSGSTVTSSIYGGSNEIGTVTTSNVSVTGGSAGNVYGGNNMGGTCTTTNITINGGRVTNAVYGGGYSADTTTANITLTSSPATIPSVYGGGKSANILGTTTITKNGTNVTTLYGGSDTSGTVNNSIINHNGGTATTIYGGNNMGGNTLTSYVNFAGGNSTDIYGGGNQASGTTSNISVTAGTVANIYGGGNRAGLTTSNVSVTGGTVTGNVYGGSNNSGTVTTTNVTAANANGTIAAIFGGGNNAAVGSANVTANSGTIGVIYGGGNLAQVTGNTRVDINGGTISNNIYGGGNFGVVNGNSNVTITNATILGSVYAGGNGNTATLEGNTTITIDGNTIIGTPSSVPPATGSVFGGGNQAYTGTSTNNNSQSTVNIAGGTIYGNVYGGANTSVIYGNTDVNIGLDAISNNSGLSASPIYIKGHVFGGGEANASGSETYDWYFISVTEGTNITVNGNGYQNFDINGSFYGGGNASSASGDSYLYIYNYGTMGSPKKNISIQRVTYATIDNSSMVLKGAIDRANDYDKELFSISRVEELKLKNNSELYLETGANLLEKFESLDSSGNPAVVTIDTENNTLTRTVNNRIYMFEGKNLNIAKDQQVSDYGEVIGMTFFGMFNYDGGNNVNTGIYNATYNPGDTLSWNGLFSRGSYVLGLHALNHNITVNGFYTNYMNEDTLINEVNYIEPTPAAAAFYMWFIGENVIEYNVNLTASKYSTLGSVEVPFLEFSDPNTSFEVLTLDASELASGINLIDKNSIPRIASTDAFANSNFGLSMEASNTGWLTTGRTSFYTTEPYIRGVTYYEGENSNIVPTMLFYLYHSKNITLEQDLGTVRISVLAITKIDALSSEVQRLVINVNMSTALFQTNEYEGAMTPGDKYELFASTATNITGNSSLSAYYALYGAGTNMYQTGYHRVLTSSFVLPENTKITMLNFVNGIPEYYYYTITSADVTRATAEYALENECSYALSLFTRMGSFSTTANYNDAAENARYYDGTDSNEEFIFIVDFGEAGIASTLTNNTLLIEMRDSQEETIVTVLGIEHALLTYNIYTGYDAAIDIDAEESANPLYIGYSDILDVNVGYQSSLISGTVVTDTSYFNDKLGLQIYLLNSNNELVSGTDLTGAYFLMDGNTYYPDIDGITHIKLSDKVGNTEKWITLVTENSNLATGTYTLVLEAFASPDGVYYSGGDPDYKYITLNVINSTYGLNPVINNNSVIFNKNNDKNLSFTINYTSLLTNPNIRISMYRRKYDTIYSTRYDLVDFQDYVNQTLITTNNPNEYLLVNNPNATNNFTIIMNSTLQTGTYRLVFKLYDGNTLIGEVIRYIIIK